MYLLSNKIEFPPVALADKNGLLAIGGDLSPERLLLAYKSGIFPWNNEGEPIIWYSPNPRMVLFPNQLRVSKSMQKFIEKTHFKITFNQCFTKVIDACKNVKRNDQLGTWITKDMLKAYQKLNTLGIAKSVEVWDSEKLVGGLYGIDLGHIFCGESMFSNVSNASKLAFVALTKQLKMKNYKLIDCQIYNTHLASLGAIEIPRNEFIKML